MESATSAGLVYVSQTGVGLRRKGAGKGFQYLDSENRRVADPLTLQRIRSLVIPRPGKVWICADPNGHLQAMGLDFRGRRQYRYHPDYRAFRNNTKFDRMLRFAKVVPAIRAQVLHDLGLPGLPREKVVATIVRLLETTFIRIGNDEYARENQSFGLTTLRNRHVAISGSTLRFTFRGKSGQDHDVEVKNRRVARIVRECQDLPGHELFQYVDESGTRRSLGSSDVNAYLQTVTGADFTAKDFRTWAGTVQTALALAAFEPFASEAEAKRNVVAAIKDTARRLGNRPATCRNYYVHPAVLEAYFDGSLTRSVRTASPDEHDEEAADLYPEECSVVRLLRKARRAPELEQAAG